MTFEEEFPEFADRIIEGRYVPYVVVELALTEYQQRVREAIFKLQTFNDYNGIPREDINADELMEELGLNDF